jgi:phthiocerol/phenolphthiocerol synthesis type-I polyketide synthase E
LSSNSSYSAPDGAVAIIGMNLRVPGAGTVEKFWSNLCEGVESIVATSRDDQLRSGIHAAEIDHPRFVPVAATIGDIDQFDANFFGYSPADAALIDPQQRLLLQAACDVLTLAGYVPAQTRENVGVFSSSGAPGYLLALANSLGASALDRLDVRLGNEKDYASTRLSYKLDLRGPSVTVQTACSSSLVAVHLACQSLLAHECDMAIAGGISLTIPGRLGYLYHEGGVQSPDGHCRSFDAEARGAVFGDGVGVVLLKRLSDALNARDTIDAVILGSAVTNNGAKAAGFTAPDVEGYANAILQALAVADVDASTIGYVEGHGSATSLGDPIEIEALTRAFRQHTLGQAYCWLGSVKSNIGHLDTAAGVVGLIKSALAVKHGRIPPSLHFQAPNPRSGMISSPFRVPRELTDWPARGGPRRAGVSALGMGGTNVHVVLEQAPSDLREEDPLTPRAHFLVPISASSPAGLRATTKALLEDLRETPGKSLSRVAFTLQAGRRALRHRRAVVADTISDLIQALENNDPARLYEGEASATPSVAFMFPGQGAQYPGMARGLYEECSTFRSIIDPIWKALEAPLRVNLRELLVDASTSSESDRRVLAQTRLAQPALFSFELALAQLLMRWGIQPSALVGHSVGELVAATLAGVWTLEDALHLIAARGQALQAECEGAMLAVASAADDLLDLLQGEVVLTAVNADSQCTVSGPTRSIAAFAAQLEQRGIHCHALNVSHAFHSPSMRNAAREFAAVVARHPSREPTIPFVSNVTGGWVVPGMSVDPAYWGSQVLEPVQFARGLVTLVRTQPTILLEVGPGSTLSGLARSSKAVANLAKQIYSCDMGGRRRKGAAYQALLSSVACLWTQGVAFDWRALNAGNAEERVRLPGYVYDLQRFWVSAQEGGPSRISPEVSPTEDGQASLDVGLELPTWRLSSMFTADPPELDACVIFSDRCGLTQALAASYREANSVPLVIDSGSLQSADPVSELKGALSRAGASGRIAIYYLRPLDTKDPSFSPDSDELESLAASLQSSGGPAERDVTVIWVTSDSCPMLGSQSQTLSELSLPGLPIGNEQIARLCRTVYIDRSELESDAGRARIALGLRREAGITYGSRQVALRHGARFAFTEEPAGPPVARSEESRPRVGRTIPGGVRPTHADGPPIAQSKQALYPRALPQSTYVEPVTPTEKALERIWCDAFGLDKVGIDDDFLDLGGHSLLATHLTRQINDLFRSSLSLIDLLAAPTIRELSRRLVPPAQTTD